MAWKSQYANVGAHRQPLSRSFGTNETQQLREGQLVGRMMLQRLATGATGVKQARYRRRPTRGSEALARACAVYTQPVYRIPYGRSLALAVQCETTHGVYDFRRGFCTLVLSFTTVLEFVPLACSSCCQLCLHWLLYCVKLSSRYFENLYHCPPYIVYASAAY